MSEQTVLIINGRDMRYGSAKGALNTFLADTAASHLKEEGFTVETTRVADGYEIAEEARKWQQADVVLFQFPIYWFAAPAVLKRYIEEVYQHDTFYSSAPEYGRGGLLHGKRYLVSTTWNAPKDVFADPSSFFNGRSVDDVLADFHFTQAFVGLTRLPSISFHDVIKHPDAAAYAEQLKTHLNKALNI
ncbi:NAD(P)H-dependent oxidoreductase [Sporolactobacillus inulinus]|uniref:NADPH-quinone reductase n=1 Tax=Sporolactobacillus inulinus CASD TaxID=1069536 RepID=A0A0U1QRS5_9BACL|nr:NAD(P)H-dependent oxidoreductase [Sporolactobacillus inulinus]KLI03504.1 NADPH-quinone reductase [Sporolactobacillus inulinus CASD]GEB77781.1 NAD(P)H dehydrogenase (quinone) [Sporolactobacillus inulinus]